MNGWDFLDNNASYLFSMGILYLIYYFGDKSDQKQQQAWNKLSVNNKIQSKSKIWKNGKYFLIFSLIITIVVFIVLLIMDKKKKKQRRKLK